MQAGRQWAAAAARTSFSGWLILAGWALLSAGCDPGFIFVEFVWPEGRPVYSDDDPASTFVRVEEREHIDEPGQILSVAPPHPFSQQRTNLPEVRYGSNRVIIAETRESPDADSQVLYYGISEFFSISRGEHIVVPTYMGPISPPQKAPVGGNIMVVTSSRAPGQTGDAEVDLLLFTDTGVEVRLSNVVGLPERSSELLRLDGLEPVETVEAAPKGFRGYRVRWNLDRDLDDPCVTRQSCPRRVFARFIDAQGYGSRPASADVLLDTAGPEVLARTASIQIAPGPDNVLRRVPSLGEPEAVGVGSTVRVIFALNEDVSIEPVLTTRPGHLPLALLSKSGSSFVFGHTLPEGERPQGPHEVVVEAVDAVGNRATHVLELPWPGLNIDTQPPRPPAPRTLIHERQPWGSDADGPGAKAFIRGTEGSVEPKARVVILAVPGQAELSLLGQGTADDTGAIARFPLLGTDDRAEVYVIVLDSAGNPSSGSGPASRVDTGVWVASLRGKVPGSAVENPHEVQALSWTSRTLEQDPLAVQPLDAAALAALAGQDDQSVRIEQRRRWEDLPLTAESPPARARAVMAFDAVRGRAVLFGGSGATGLLQDTWEWDGRRWSSFDTRGVAPSPRQDAAMAFDSIHDRMVLFGGVDEGGRLLNDTWAWDGNVWTELHPQFSPNPRAGHAMLYEPKAGAVVIVGGRTGEGPTNEMWSFEGTSWGVRCGSGLLMPPCPNVGEYPAAIADPTGLFTFGGRQPNGRALAGPTTVTAPGEIIWVPPPGFPQPPLPGSEQPDGPSRRYGAQLAYDPLNGNILLFGGRNALTFMNELWSNWRRVSMDASPQQPMARAYAAVTFDFEHRRLLVFGGEGLGGRMGDTWAWEEAGFWRELTPSSERPPERSRAAMAYDESDHRMILFGGRLGFAPGDDTWFWNGARWQRYEGSDNEPAPREDHAMVTMGGRPALFGGTSTRDGLVRGIWRWTSSGWSWGLTSDVGHPATNEGAGPGELSRHALAYDRSRHLLLTFGGIRSRRLRGDLWGLTADADQILYHWSPLALMEAGGVTPSIRQHHAMVFDAARNRAVLFGGLDENDTYLNDVWEWDGAVWNAPLPTQAPSPRQRPGVAYDGLRGRVVVFGGLGGFHGEPLNDLWEWTGETWIEQHVAEARRPPGGRWPLLAYDPDQHAVLFLSQETMEPWLLSADPRARPGLRFRFVTDGLLARGGALRGLAMSVRAGARGFDLQVPGNGGSQAGGEVLGWDRVAGGWMTLGQTEQGLEGLERRVVEISEGGAAQKLVGGARDINFVIQPQAGLANGLEPGAVAVDGLELRVTYGYPD